MVKQECITVLICMIVLSQQSSPYPDKTENQDGDEIPFLYHN